MIEQSFNYTDVPVKEMTNFFETRVEKCEPREDKKKSSASSKRKNKERHNKKKRKHDNSYSRRGKGMTLFSALWSPTRNLL